MDHRQKIVCHFRIAAFGNGLMIVTTLAQSNVASPIVRDDERARSNSLLDKPTQRLTTSILGDRKPDSPGVSAILPLILRSPRFAMPDFDSTGHENIMIDAPAFATGAAADVGFISLDVFLWLAAYSILITTHHPSAVIAHPAPASASPARVADITNRTVSSTEAPLAFAVLTTDRKAA